MAQRRSWWGASQTLSARTTEVVESVYPVWGMRPVDLGLIADPVARNVHGAAVWHVAAALAPSRG